MCVGGGVGGGVGGWGVVGSLVVVRFVSCSRGVGVQGGGGVRCGCVGAWSVFGVGGPVWEGPLECADSAVLGGVR